MLKRFFQDGIIYGGANLLSKGVIILLVPIYARVFAPDEMGVVDMIFVFGSVVAIVVPIGIVNGVARYLPEAVDDKARRLCASSAWWFTVAAYLAFAVMAIALSDVIARSLLDGGQWSGVLRIAVIAQLCQGLQYFLQTLLRWRLRARQFVICNCISMVTMTVAVAVLLLAYDAGVAGVYYGQITGALVGGGLAWAYNRDLLMPVFDRDFTKRMLVYSLPLLPALLGELVGNYVDRLAIRNLMSLQDVGVYGIGYRFAAVVGLLMAGFSTAITPLILTHYKEPGTPEALARIFRYFTVCAVMVVAGLILFSQEILWLFVTPTYYGAQPIIPILGAALLLFGMYSFAPGLSIAMKTRTIAAIHLATGAMNVGLSFAFTTVFGIVGAATATLTSAAATVVLYFVFSQRHYRVPHDFRTICLAVAVGLGVAGGGLSAVSDWSVSVGGMVAKVTIYIFSVSVATLLLIKSGELKSACDILRHKLRTSGA